MSRDLGGGDAALVRRTARRIAWQSAALVALVVVALSGLAVFAALHQQKAETASLLRQATASADDVGDPPASTWLAIRKAGRTQATPGRPAPLPLTADLDRVAASRTPIVRDLQVGDREFRVRTAVRGTTVVQAALDLTSQHREWQHLIAALLTASIFGLVLAAVIGSVMGRRAVQPLAQALALQRDFVADASHELRTPLTLLSTRAQLLARDLRRSHAAPTAIADSAGVVRDTERMVAIVDDLLLAAEGATTTDSAPVNLSEVTADLADSAGAYAAGLEITVTATRDYGPTPLIVGNQVAVRRALTALLDNAMAHTPPGGSVTLTAFRQGDDCVIDVADTGSGLDPDSADRVFERFHSGAQRAGRRSYGLGLSLAAGVAARHNGSLTLLRTGPDGTTFRLQVPALPDAGQGSDRTTRRS